jgi:hypothetical protein
MFNKLLAIIAISTASITGATYIIDQIQPEAQKVVAEYSAIEIKKYYDYLIMLNNNPDTAFQVTIDENKANIENIKIITKDVIQYNVGNSCIEIQKSTDNQLLFFNCLTGEKYNI